MTRKKRILHFIESEGVYGAEHVILNLSKQMQQNSHYEGIVGCIVPQPNSHSSLYDAAQARGIEAIKVPISNTRLMQDLPNAAKQLQLEKIDLIHSHGYKPSVFGFVIRLLKKIPIIATCHLWFVPSNGPLKMRTMIKLEKFFYRWFPKVVAVSDPIKSILLKNNLRSDQVDVVRNGVELPSIMLSDAEIQKLRLNLNITDSDFFILNSARLSPQKAQWILVKAAAILKKQGQAIRILIVGEGILLEDLQKQIISEDVADYVHLMGFRNDINKLLMACDAFALPSIDEGMPMSLLEAAATQKPIITTKVGDIGKLVEHNISGLIIPTEDPTALAAAITLLKSDPSFAQKLAAEAHQRMVENYSSQSMAKRYLSIYDNILSSI